MKEEKKVKMLGFDMINTQSKEEKKTHWPESYFFCLVQTLNRMCAIEMYLLSLPLLIFIFRAEYGDMNIEARNNRKM